MFLCSLSQAALLCLALHLPKVANAEAKRDWGLAAAPPPSLFLRRAFATVAVLGDFAYIDGGEVSQLDADGRPIKSYPSNGINSTLSIDLSESWSASEVKIRELPKQPQVRNRQGLWKNEATNTLWIWGGSSVNDAPRENTESWKLDADGQGGGKWSREEPTNPTFFSELRRSAQGAFASTEDAGFWFGGRAIGRMNRDKDPYVQPVPGILSYNMTTKTWANETTNAFSENGTVSGGNALYIPTFGPNGLVTLLGGSTWGLDVNPGAPTGWLDFYNLTFFDPVTRDWYWQKTTGNAPTARQDFCSVGASGTNGTYEIFVFGGTNTVNTYDDVFVLSLPGFVWTQVIYDAKNSRRFHTCAVVGRRQMLSVGGWDGQTGWSGVDPWPQGLGLFDMTEWVWKTDYDANAKDYEASSVIQDWYKKNDASSIEWSSDRVEALFNQTNSRASVDRGENANNDGKSSNSTVPVTAIVGAVVGAIFGVIIGLALLYFVRRRVRKKGTAFAKDDVAPTSQTHYEALPPTELHAPAKQHELDSRQMPGQELWAPVLKPEMAGGDGHHFTVTELDAQQGLLGRNDEDQYKYRQH